MRNANEKHSGAKGTQNRMASMSKNARRKMLRYRPEDYFRELDKIMNGDDAEESFRKQVRNSLNRQGHISLCDYVEARRESDPVLAAAAERLWFLEVERIRKQRPQRALRFDSKKERFITASKEERGDTMED